MTGLSEIRETDGSVYLRITAIDGGVQAGWFNAKDVPALNGWGGTSEQVCR
tara:strand:+ start:20567 stop:20719 length:153 start_codon:yes stop_codon:yes gene_type:complete